MMPSLFHYTDANALFSIINKGKLWGTDIRYTNDWMEYVGCVNHMAGYGAGQKPGFSKLSEGERESRIKDLRGYLLNDIDDSIAICSFSTAKNVLSQWARYTPAHGGYCIEFDSEKLRDGLAPGEMLVDCNYDEIKQEYLLAAIADGLFDDLEQFRKGDGAAPRLTDEIVRTITRYKNRHFWEESEHRIVKAAPASGFEFRPSGPFLLPYLEFQIPLEAIVSITVGPTRDENLSRKALQRFLKSKKLDHVEAKVSGIPLVQKIFP